MKNLIVLFILCVIYSAAFAQKKLLSQPYQPRKLSGTINDYLEELKQNSGTVIEYSSSNIEINKRIQLEGNETYRLTRLDGTTIATGHFDGSLNVSNILSGMYILSIENNKGVESFRMVVANN